MQGPQAQRPSQGNIKEKEERSHRSNEKMNPFFSQLVLSGTKMFR